MLIVLMRNILTLVAVILGTWNCPQIHGPEIFWKNILCLRVLTVGFTESCLVCMWEVACYWCRWDRSIVLWVSWVCQAIITADGTALGPPQARLSCPTLLTGRSQVTRPIVSTGAACSRFACSILEAIYHTIKGIATCGNTARGISCVMFYAGFLYPLPISYYC